MDLLEYANVLEVINAIKPDEVYNLAAQSHVHVSFTQPLVTSHINALGPLMLLEAVRRFSPHSRFYQASTSEMFGSSPPPQDENTPLPAKEPLCRLKTLRTLDDDKL
jgi:GDPmannose 4,6-dehydratase